jgi:hypothetical protein
MPACHGLALTLARLCLWPWPCHGHAIYGQASKGACLPWPWHLPTCPGHALAIGHACLCLGPACPGLPMPDHTGRPFDRSMAPPNPYGSVYQPIWGAVNDNGRRGKNSPCPPAMALPKACHGLAMPCHGLAQGLPWPCHALPWPCPRPAMACPRHGGCLPACLSA